jgi:hypothetical protein
MMRLRILVAVHTALVLSALAGLSAAERTPLSPHMPAVIAEKEAAAWSFNDEKDAWPVLNEAKTLAGGGVLKIESTGTDPYVRIPVTGIDGPVIVRWRMKTSVQGPVDLYWTTPSSPNMDNVKTVRCRTVNDGTWRAYSVVLPAEGKLQALRFDPCTQPGIVEISEAKVSQLVLHPLQFEKLDASEGFVSGTIRNSGPRDLEFTIGGKRIKAGAGQAAGFEMRVETTHPFEQVKVQAAVDGLPPLGRTLYVHNPKVETDWLTLEKDAAKVCVAKNGSGLRLFFGGKMVAFAAPLAECGGEAVPLKGNVSSGLIEMAGGAVERMRISIEKNDVLFNIKGCERITGPSVHVVGTMEQGLLAGVEYLEKGDRSSSDQDIETMDHVRYEPDPMWLTMPLAAFVTDAGSVAMLWDDTALQPVFSAPNLYDCTADQVMALKGSSISFTLRLNGSFGSGTMLHDLICWAIMRRGLPGLPELPRSAKEQTGLYLECLTKTIRSPDGWLHATWDNVKHQPLSAPASCVWRLSGEVPKVSNLLPGGSHVENWAAYFVTGRAARWLEVVNGKANDARAAQHADGSFRYNGPYRRGHFEDTTVGFCAEKALLLLDHAMFTGDRRTLDAGVKALEFMKKFRTPRGAQHWEIPIHSPDILAAAWAVRAYVLGYELTGRKEYIDIAKRWALSGMAFVYQWGKYPVQLYASTAVLGATDWNGIVWIGLPVQWCGVCYAYSLMMLEKYDHTLDWRKVAEGLVRTAE